MMQILKYESTHEAKTIDQVDMITEKTEDGGGRFSVVNLDIQQRKLVVETKPHDRGNVPERPSIVEHGQRSPPIDIAYGS